MKMKKIPSVLFCAFFLFLAPFSSAENVSIKFSLNQNSIGESDPHTWIQSFNSLWQDWASSKGGQITGQFEPISFGLNFEVELRVRLIAGLSLHFGASPFSDSNEGEIQYPNAAATQKESHFILNSIKAYPIKIGLSYSVTIPKVPRLHAAVNIGRRILIVSYKTKENYQAFFTSGGREWEYWYEKENSFNSEALGFYTSLGIEYDILKHIALSLEAEKTWSKVDGFKGPYTYQDYEGINDSGKASLYFYESDQWGLGQTYSVLYGHETKPEESYIKNIRQGELNFGGLAIKFGIRFKF